MKDTRETSILRDKLYDLIARLRILREKGIIKNGTYGDYMFLILSARTLDQLDEINHDLMEFATVFLLEQAISRSRPARFLQDHQILAQTPRHETTSPSSNQREGIRNETAARAR